MQKLFILVAALLMLAVAGCSHSTDIQTVRSSIPNAPSAAWIEKAILKSASSRGWETKKSDPKTIEATLTQGDHTVVVQITYTDTTYAIKYKDSTNMSYDPAERTIHKSYNRWVRILDKDIRNYPMF